MYKYCAHKKSLSAPKQVKNFPKMRKILKRRFGLAALIGKKYFASFGAETYFL